MVCAVSDLTKAFIDQLRHCSVAPTLWVVRVVVRVVVPGFPTFRVVAPDFLTFRLSW